MRASRVPKLPVFNTIGFKEKSLAIRAMKKPLSGYLGGIERSAGEFINRLERDWCNAFKVPYSIPCNSATSGLLAACVAAGIQRGDLVWTSPFTMSATAACAIFLGAEVKFIDIEPVRYSLHPDQFPTRDRKPKAVIVPNIFGHPAYLSALRLWCDQNNAILIEDNAQSPFAVENGQYAGTVGHCGVFSLNVHKHIQAGEGGVVVTNSPNFARRVRDVINHGELRDGGRLGLNLRMTEVTAAIACSQLEKAPGIIAGRKKLADNIGKIFSSIPWVTPSFQDEGCRHVYYLWTARVPLELRDTFVQRLNAVGVPVRAGYSKNLCDVFDPSQQCPNTDEINNTMISFEICAYDPKAHHLEKMAYQVKKVAFEMEKEKLLP